MVNKRISSIMCALAISLVAIMLIVSIEVVGAVDPSLSNSGGGNWQYSREIAVSENSGNTLTDYQVLVQLSGNNFPINADPYGVDIRFTDSNEKELSYWIESWDYTSNSALIWVKVPSILANDNTNIKMYYGNPTAGLTSDGVKTFEHFDDFSGIHRITDYRVLDVRTSDGVKTFEHFDDFSRIHRITDYRVLDVGDIGAPSSWALDPINKKIIQESNIYGGNFGSALLTGKSLASFEVKVKTKEVDDDIIGLLFSFQTASNFNHYSYSNDYAGMQIDTFTECTRGGHRWIGNDNTGICTNNLASDNKPPAKNSIVEIKIRKYGNVIKVFQDDIEILSAISTYGAGDVGLMTDGDDGGEFYPPFIVRKYAFPEPTIILGDETETTTPTATFPNQPQNLKATAGDDYINLRWEAPSDNGGSSITSYKIYRDTTSGKETQLAKIGNVLAYKDNDVTDGQTYYYKVSAINSEGEGTISNEASAIIPIIVSTPTPTATSTSTASPDEGGIVPTTTSVNGKLLQLMGVILIVSGLLFTALTSIKNRKEFKICRWNWNIACHHRCIYIIKIL